MCQIPKHREEGRLIEGERRKTNTVEDVQPEGVEEKQLEKKSRRRGRRAFKLSWIHRSAARNSRYSSPRHCVAERH